MSDTHGAGHNSGVSGEHLKSFIERIERLMEERKGLGADITEVFSEAKSSGYDPKIMRRVIKLRGMNEADRQNEEAVLGVYLAAVGL